MLLSEKQIENACSWLLENSGPSIRYRTLTEIMGLDPQDPRVLRAYNELLKSKRLSYISALQNAGGSFGSKTFHYGTESTETYLRELMEMGLRSDEQILQKGIRHALKLNSDLSKDIGWIPGIYLEPVGRSGPSQIVEEWFVSYINNFKNFLLQQEIIEPCSYRKAAHFTLFYSKENLDSEYPQKLVCHFDLNPADCT